MRRLKCRGLKLILDRWLAVKKERVRIYAGRLEVKKGEVAKQSPPKPVAVKNKQTSL